MRRHLLLEEIIEPIVTGLGCTLWGLQYLPQGKQSLIRLYIDKEGGNGGVEGGVTIDDCERVSRQVDAVLSVKRLVAEGYTLEVSSPGLDRILFTQSQYRDQIGKTITVRVIAPIEGRRNFKGTLLEVLEEALVLNIETGSVKIPFKDITEARVVPFADEGDKGSGKGKDVASRNKGNFKGKGKDKVKGNDNTKS